MLMPDDNDIRMIFFILLTLMGLWTIAIVYCSNLPELVGACMMPHCNVLVNVVDGVVGDVDVVVDDVVVVGD